MAACSALLELTGCSNLTVGGGDFGSLYQMTTAIWSGSGQDVTLRQAAAVPYASMGVRVGDGRQMMIVLAGGSGKSRLWTSAAHVTLVTIDGRIVRTSGLEHNLDGYETIRSSRDAGGIRSILWLADFSDLGLYSVPIRCEDRPLGETTITILGKDIRALRVDETCASESAQLDWSFRNSYWIDPESGLTWRSIQNVHPKLKAVETEILRPPAS